LLSSRLAIGDFCHHASVSAPVRKHQEKGGKKITWNRKVRAKRSGGTVSLPFQAEPASRGNASPEGSREGECLGSQHFSPGSYLLGTGGIERARDLESAGQELKP
jgi:hypothetical protein